MATVMTWGNSEGTKGRCDAKCHDAREPECRCMCDGRYHGRSKILGGMQQAMKEEGERIMESAKQKADAEGYQIEIKTFEEVFGGLFA